MNTFLQQVTDDLIQQYTLAGLQQCTLVFPMHRAGLFVKQYLGEKILSSGTPVVLPHFTTIDSLADSLSDLHSEEEIISVCTLYDIYAKHTHCTLSIDAFYGWGVQLLNDFSNVDMALVDASKFMTYTAQLKQSEQTILDEDARQRLEELLHPDKRTIIEHSIREYFTDLWEKLPLIYEDFRQQQLAANVGTRGARMRWTIEHFHDASIQQRIQGRTYVFVGFNYLLRAERELMRLFHRQHQARFYWDYDRDFTLDDTVYKFIHDNIKEFGQDLLSTFNSPLSTKVIACQSSAAQAQYVHEWLLAPEHRSGSSAIVVADESLLQSVIYSLPDATDLSARINITKGYPLSSTILYSHVHQFILTQINAAIAPEQLLKEMIAYLETTYRHINQQYLTDALKNTWQSTLLDESYYQIQRVLRQLLTLLIQNSHVQAHLNQSRILCNLIRRKLEMVTIPFHGEPITDVQVIGVLETRLLDFDHVLILNVEEDIVPSRSSDRSFLPYDLRREYGMSTREEESRIYAYNFFRLFRRAQDVTLTYSDAFTNDRMCTMSRFLMQMLSVPNHIQQLRLTESAMVTPFQLQHTAFLDHPEDQFPDHLSPSSISTYIECPRQFYLKQIRDIRESSVDEVMLPVGLIGNLCHAVLQDAYLTMCQHVDSHAIHDNRQLAHPIRITKDLIEWYLSDFQHLRDALQMAYVDINTRYAKDHQDADIQAPYVKEQHEAENFAVLEMAKKVLRRDMETAPFTMVWLEHPVQMTIHNLKIEGVIDRMDLIEQEGNSYLRILDYKTGGFTDEKIRFNYSNLFSDPEKKYVLQTFIYSEMVRQNLPKGIPANLPIRPELFFVKTRNEADILHMYDKAQAMDEPVLDFAADCQQDFQTGFEELTRQIAANCQPGQEFLPQQDDKICGQSYCPFHLLCGREKKK